MEPKYEEGRKVKIIPLIDGFGRRDPRVDRWVGKTGEIVKAYYVSQDEVWEKTLRLVDTYCYDIRLDNADEVARGIPEAGLDAQIFGNKGE